MSKLTEYIKAGIKGIKNIDQVINGIRNDVRFESGDLGKDIEDEIIRRRLICNTCPFMSTNQIKNGLYKTDREDEHCTLCSCNIKYKTSCLICNCGIEEYNKNNPENQLELKWKKITE